MSAATHDIEANDVAIEATHDSDHGVMVK